MAEKPILFQGDMARAILEDRKTETRRVINKRFRFNDDPDKYFVFYSGYADSDTPGVKEPGHYVQFADGTREDPGFYDLIKCPYGQVGDRLWVRETWQTTYNDKTDKWEPIYKADDKLWIDEDGPIKWKPSIHMFRKFSRITLEITEIKVERVQDITYWGAINEGLKKDWDGTHHWYSFPEGYKEKYTGYTATKQPVYAFRILWDSINEKRGYGWDLNPWVWVIKYKRIEK